MSYLWGDGVIDYISPLIHISVDSKSFTLKEGASGYVSGGGDGVSVMKGREKADPGETNLLSTPSTAIACPTANISIRTLTSERHQQQQ